MRNRLGSVGSHLDDAVGGVLEHAIVRHHRNRLTKLDHAGVLESVAGPDL